MLCWRKKSNKLWKCDHELWLRKQPLINIIITILMVIIINRYISPPPKKKKKKSWNYFFFQQEMSDLKNNKSRFWRKIKHETIEMARVTVNMLKGNGSKVSYLFIPAFISLFWLGICFFTTRNPNVTLEDQYIKVRKKYSKSISPFFFFF